ncbi:MAG: hypothetical protein IJT94_16885 [Oscillibacter sp.]|nr:hypothetical protein [Oscillibacter sp.]
MAQKLKNLKIVKVDFVEEGANPDAHIVLTKQKDAVPEAVEKEASSFSETLSMRYLDKIADDMWNLCAALNDSLCSILCDPEIDAAAKAAAMRENVGEFTAVIEDAVTSWTAGKPVGFVLKSAEGQADLLAKRMEAAARRMKPDTGGHIEHNELEGDESEMRIDKSKLTPEEAAQLEAFEKKAGIPEEAPAEASGAAPAASVSASGQEPTPTAKSAPAAPVANPAPSGGDNEDIFKGMSAAARQKFLAMEEETAALRKFREGIEDEKLREVAGQYALIGKSADELFPVLKNLKATSQEAYDTILSTLDAAKRTVEKSGVFSEVGKTGNGTVARGGAVKEAEGKAMNLMKSRTDLNFAQALDAVLLEDPDLAHRYETED